MSLNKPVSVSAEIGGKKMTIEAGKMAKQADGSVLVSYGDTRVLVTACSSKNPKEGLDFFPLTVEFSEKYYAAGKIPGSFHRREAKATSESTLSARLIDRPIRPLFPEGYRNETQVIATILSVDLDADVDCAAAMGVSAALSISDIPFAGPTGGVRIGRIGGKFVVNPSWTAVENGETDLEIFIAATKNAIMMVEGGAREASEEDCLTAIMMGHKEIQKGIAMIEELKAKVGKAKRVFVAPPADESITKKIETLAKAGLEKALRTKEKHARYGLVDDTRKAALAGIISDDLKKTNPDGARKMEKEAKTAFELLQYNLMREMILADKTRIDGRNLTTVRPIEVETGLLPRTHGSALFTRGETQVLATLTLGTSEDEGIIDTMFQRAYRKFSLHYNFPPFSVGEAGRLGFTSRREIGHGALAERSIKAMFPKHEDFPYTVRLVCETLESNGSSSMGSVCASSMAIMDAGIPYPKPVAGIAMGLIKESDRVAVLTDILGDEDHLGDMDFKVAGTKDGITGIQMDIKIEGVNESILRTALAQAREGRLHILGEMAKAITETKAEMSAFAPRITTLKIPVDKIREVIGSGGKVIKDLVAKSGAKIDINDDGVIQIATSDMAARDRALQMINDIIATPEIGKIYKGKVKKIVEFGAFIGILPNQDGLLHVSEIAHERVNRVEDFLKEGDEIEVKVLEVDKMGKVRPSRKVLLPPPAGGAAPTGGAGGTGGGDRGPRRDDRGGAGGGDRGPRR
ncbi:MAG: polyribonucleotide nucleotidyltransferase [Cryobacterium sp.]|nr:polyribonucleotide nucleotidyltransferase [Oligoflexia bacterium]